MNPGSSTTDSVATLGTFDLFGPALGRLGHILFDIPGALQRFLLRLENIASRIIAAVIGTVLGMVALGAFSVAPLKFGIGVVTLGYVASKQGVFAVPGTDRLRKVCFTERTATKASLGFVSGFLFGATNVSVQVVESLDSLELDRSTFVGVLSMILVGLSGARVGFAPVFLSAPAARKASIIWRQSYRRRLATWSPL